MARYIVGFDRKWQDSFSDPEEAINWAEEVAATGRTVEVVTRKFGFHHFLTGFPESERDALAARWKMPWFSGGIVGDGTGAPHHRYNSASGHSGGHGGHGGHGGGN